MDIVRHTTNSVMYSPSLLASDFSRPIAALQDIAASGCDYVHLDVMDGRFVPNITFGTKFIEDIRKDSDLIFDTHLMIEEPEKHIEAFAKAGSNIITVHQESTKHLWRCLSMIKELGCECGVAINPGTSVSSIEAVLPYTDYILVMSVNPGWGGQKFIPEVVGKIQELNVRRSEEGYHYQIEVDGGIGKGNIKLIANAGTNLVVMGTAFFNQSYKKEFIDELNSILEDE